MKRDKFVYNIKNFHFFFLCFCLLRGNLFTCMKKPLKVKLIFSYWKRLLKGNFYEDLEKEQRKGNA
jgi:hypothetical protein